MSPAARQRLYLHIGLPKSGTTFLQALLANNRGALRAAGSIYPFVRRECMFHAAVELREQHDRWGLSHDLIDGTWEALLGRVRAFDGQGIISHEILAGAMPPHIERIAADTADLELHVVVTARDLAKQAAAHWQEQVKNGSRWSFATFESELFETGESEADEVGFWRSQDLLAVLRRWGAIVPPDQVHVVTVPRTGADPFELWRRFCDAVGLAPDVVDPSLEPRTNESLGAAQVALLRRVVAALDGRLEQPHYAHVVKRYFAQTLLAQVESPRPVTPPGLRETLTGIASGWVEEIRARGHRVHGDLAELVPEPADPAAPHPDAAGAEEMMAGLPQVLASMLIEIATLREASGDPRQLPPRPSSGGPRDLLNAADPPGATGSALDHPDEVEAVSRPDGDASNSLGARVTRRLRVHRPAG